ncbi:MAG: hypothetical protein E5W72_00980 [Mesorhizobium sp.]|uniref:hypothetical protein n=1 Tax=Mesorhizobium sp. TaxID=1871066 RepID=UPI00121A34C2|nr:hypothetical protein [Mesorhizobium sp.]TIS37104.1 MAG: hypothetical protein E5W95_22460 [Mesorhizobium sp.]TIS96305.1 MAG: hypothetical protein E5W87_29895 [Mesorhizobium sp.]TIT55097.1 MAG: hypothetical protein E5W72_00980 [Mesorhizobium sp.]TKD45737.1 MAG: hypothetical protein E5W98_12665 [Mesorhizobium sp.]
MIIVAIALKAGQEIESAGREVGGEPLASCFEDINVFENRWRIPGGGWTKACDRPRRHSHLPTSAESTKRQQRPFVVEIKQKMGS